jgi:predicted Zn-dependent protease
MFLIEKGEIGQPIQKLRITDNLLRMLKNIDGLGRDVQQIRWWEVETPTFIPFLRIKDVPMTAATQ